MAAYKLRCSVFGHEKDVRGVCAANMPVNAIISGSRDNSARVWIPNGCVVVISKLLSDNGVTFCHEVGIFLKFAFHCY